MFQFGQRHNVVESSSLQIDWTVSFIVMDSTGLVSVHICLAKYTGCISWWGGELASRGLIGVTVVQADTLTVRAAAILLSLQHLCTGMYRLIEIQRSAVQIITAPFVSIFSFHRSCYKNLSRPRNLPFQFLSSNSQGSTHLLLCRC